MRRQFFRRGQRGSCLRLRTLCLLPLVLLPGVIWYLTAVSTFIHNTHKPTSNTGKQLFSFTGQSIKCVAWRQTAFCSPFGPRDPGNDKSCRTRITGGSGFCLCTGDYTVKRMDCAARSSFTCEQECERLNSDMEGAVRLPRNISCPLQGGAFKITGTASTTPVSASAARLTAQLHSHTRQALSSQDQNLSEAAHPGSHTRQTLSSQSNDEVAELLWRQFQAALVAAGHNVVVLPERRTVNHDWVDEGLHMPRREIERAKLQWRTFMDAAPKYPDATFEGRGIAILAGGGKYMVPAWVNIHMLRKTGCKLPVEMFFPVAEYPSQELEAALAALGVVCRPLPLLSPAEIFGTVVEPMAGQYIEKHLSGFRMKIAALILSSFQEVIFLDSDNVAVADPTSLLDSPEFRSTGALLWPDYWWSTAVSELREILDVSSLPKATFESGQMVFDKRRVWDGLLLTAFFNMESDLYYELFSNWMGKGDKDSFAMALAATHTPYSVVSTPVGSVGVMGQVCGRSARNCDMVFAGNTMTQHAPGSTPMLMFLHTNLSPKWGLQIPGSFDQYSRRWQVVEPGGAAFSEAFPELGDIEHEVYDSLVELRCAPFLLSYMKALSSAQQMGGGQNMLLGLPPESFDPINPGVDFFKAYRLGMRGPFEEFQSPSSWDKHVWHFKRSVLHKWHLLKRGFRRKRQYFVLW